MRLNLLAACVVLAASTIAADASTIVQVTAGQTGGAAGYDGQSFTVPGAGFFDDITFNFYAFPSTPYAIGSGYLLSQAYAGSPASLGASAPGYLGSDAAAGGVYSFGSSVTLIGGDTYYFYENAPVAGGLLSGDSVYGGGQAYFTSNGATSYSPQSVSANFLVTGNSLTPTPEPSTFALLGTGVATMFAASRRRKRAGTAAAPPA